MPKVSIIVPNYNHARYLRQRIDSVLVQTFQDFEVVLLDDCSTDESRSIISEYAKDPRIRTEFNDVNSGSTFKQWNKGVRLARGEYVWLAESDDYADERFLERLVGILEAEPDVTFVYCRSWRIAQDSRREPFADWYLACFDAQRWTADFCTDGREECRDWFVISNSVPNASAVILRRSVYERVGGADESMRLCADWKLWASMALQGRVAYVAEPLNYNREHDGTVRSRMVESGVAAAEHLAMVRWMIDRVAPSSAIVERAYLHASYLWVYPVLDRRTPSHVRWYLLRAAMRADAHALRRLVRPALISVRLKLVKEWRLVRQRFARRTT